VHPQPACLNFDGPHEFDLNFEPSDHFFVGLMEDMHDYGVYADAMDIIFDEDELDDSDVDHHANENNAHQSRNLTDTERQQIYEALLLRSDHGRLRRKVTTNVAQLFQVSRYKVQRIWQRAKKMSCPRNSS